VLSEPLPVALSETLKSGESEKNSLSKTGHRCWTASKYRALPAAARPPAPERGWAPTLRQDQARARGQGLAERGPLRGREKRGCRGHPLPGHRGAFARNL